jgi:hypothetical protein
MCLLTAGLCRLLDQRASIRLVATTTRKLNCEETMPFSYCDDVSMKRTIILLTISTCLDQTQVSLSPSMGLSDHLPCNLSIQLGHFLNPQYFNPEDGGFSSNILYATYPVIMMFSHQNVVANVQVLSSFQMCQYP